MKVWVLLEEVDKDHYVYLFDSEQKARDEAVVLAQHHWDDTDGEAYEIDRPESFDDLDQFITDCDYLWSFIIDHAEVK
jgi:hypothetical protein